MRTLLALALVASAVAAPVPKAVKKQDDAALLEGRWVGVTTDTGGGPNPDPERWLEITDGKFSTGIGSTRGYDGRTLRLDPSASPKHLDVNNTRGGFHLGIYELDGDTLRWCESSSATTRPTEIKAANGFNVLVYKRVKSKE